MKALAPGTLVGDRYRILGSLGRGGMGHVYRAEHVGLHKEVALKVLGAAGVDQLAARFEREALAVARLDHPGCVRVLDYGTADGAPYLAMELLEGPTLTAALRAEGRFSPARAIAIARALLGALAHAHGRGVLHRDVKPDNVILAGGGATRPVLIDFGLASVRDAGPLTATGMCIGSPSYIAPERLLGEPHTERSDVYAVGVILHELLAGAPPFLGTTPEEIMHEVLHRPPRPLRAIRRDVPAALEAVVRRAMAYDPARRHADAEELRSALDELTALAIAEDASAEDAAAAVDEAAQTLAIEVAQLEIAQPSPLARLLGWLRFGRWRRRGLRRLAAASSC
ncbi:MAG TPA: serine/threonine-protein kinase [Kofleriaceae bacterium]|nr:serine/threonine-protein kinase [Kofleriaceae bacterium]